MNYKDKKVRLLLSGNIVIEGVVKSWNSNSVHLNSFDGTSTSIITHPDEDIRVIKVIHEVESSKQSTKVSNEKPLENKFQEVYQQPSEDSLRIKNLADLKKELIKQEKEIVASKLKDHNIQEIREIKYEQPGFFKKQIVK